MGKELDKKKLSERDICTKFITPAILKAGWEQHQFREEVLTDGRVVVKGNMASRITAPDEKVSGGIKRADYVLYARQDIPVAVIEAKQNKFKIGHGMQQALGYGEMLDAPFVFSSNGDGFLFHDGTGLTKPTERELSLDDFPSPDELWSLYCKHRDISEPAVPILEEPYYSDGSGKKPRYYQQVAINRTIEAIAKGQDRLLLVMATGTGKTYTAFQIIWRLWKSKTKQRILFLADRNILVDQTMEQDFAPFGEKMHKITNRKVKRNYEIYLSLYQAVTGKEDIKNIYKQFPPDFFDLIVVDECHRGSASEDSAWHEILSYFTSATHLGLTATPKETKEVSNITYFGEPIYTYTLKQGIQDGFLAPYKVIRIDIDKDMAGWRPEQGKTDKNGLLIEDREYNRKDFDRILVLEKRTELVAKRIWRYLKATDPMAKTIVFCDDQDHAERMRKELVNFIPEATSNRRYVMRITGDDKEGKAQLSKFIDNDEPYPVIATTSKLLTTGVDAKTCKLIVLDQNINSMTEFKQIVGRGTRLREDYNKLFFTVMDFKGATRLFADPDFDGEPVVIIEPDPEPPEGGGDDPEPGGGNDPEPPEGEGEGEGEDEGEGGGGGTTGGRDKYYVDDVGAKVVVERTQYLDADGKLITEDLKDYSRKKLNEEFGSLQGFLRRWSEADRKEKILQELEAQGIPLAMLQEIVPNSEDFDAFDLVAHIAFDQKPLTRAERANKVKKRNYFAKYGEQAQAVLETLLEKFADQGISKLEDPKILEMPPFDKFGTKTQIRRGIFGSPAKYREALNELEQALYDEAVND